MEIQKHFSKVEDELSKVVMSKIGQVMFGPALKELQKSKVTQLRDAVVAKLASDTVSEAAIRAHRLEFLSRLTDMDLDARAVFPKPAYTFVSYRGCPISMICRSFYDQYLAAETTMVETLGVESELLEELWCESQLVEQGRAVPTVVVERAVLEGAKISRESLKRASSASPSGESIQALMQRQQKALLEDHPGYRVMKAFWDGAAGDGSEARLRREILNCLPDQGRDVTPLAACVKMQAISKSKFYGFLGLGSRALYDTSCKFVEDIKGIKPPIYDPLKSSSFMTAVMNACARWLTFSAAVGSDGAGAITKVGKAAAKDMLQKVRDHHAQDEFDQTGSYRQKLTVFGFLLADDEREELEKMINAAIQKDLKGHASTISASKGKAKPHSNTARDAVLKMCG